MWEEVTLESITSKIGDGLHGTPIYDENGDYYFINGNNLIDGRVVITPNTKTSSYTEYIKYKKDLNDRTIFISINGTLGNISFYNNEKVFLGKSVCYINIIKQVDKYFIRYVLESSLFQHYIEVYATGATIKNMGLKAMRSFTFNLPPLKTQQKIASLLSNYDKLIENNTQRIKLLESMAEELYKEWFVRLRFPGHEDVEVVDGVPEGWEKKILVDIAKLVMGQSPKSDAYNEEGNGLPFHQGVTNYGFRFPTHNTWSTEGKRYAEKGDILFSVRAPVGRLNISPDTIIIGRGLSSIRHKKEWNSFLFYALKEIFFEDDLMGSGSIFSSVTKKDMENIAIVEASEEIMSKFNHIIEPIDRDIEILLNKNQTLKQTRDLLLPRLMGGKLNVEDLDII